MKITLENIKHFQAVVKFQNLNFAAEKINISPSAISRSIKIIEDDLGYPIFNRVGRNIILNSEGSRFYEKSRYVIENYEALFNDSYQTTLQGKYKIGASHWLASKFVAPKLQDTAKSNDAIKFDLLSLDSHIAMLKVLSGDLDAAICFSPKTHSEIKAHHIHAGQLILCAGKGHPLINQKAATVIKEINKHDAIIHKSNDLISNCDDHPMFLNYDIKPKFKFFWDSDFTAIELLKTNHYWSMLPDIILKSEKSIIPLSLPKNWNAPYTISLILHKDRTSNFNDLMLKMLTD